MLINIHEAKTQFSKLINQALAGEEIIIAKSGAPLVKLVPYTAEPAKRKGEQLKGMIEIAEDFDEALPPKVLASFYGEE